MTPATAPGTADCATEVTPDVGPIPTSRRKLLRKLTSRLEHGFSATAAPELRELLGSTEETPAARLAAGEALLDWQQTRRRAKHSPVHYELDIVMVSHFALPGGNTTANAEEIRAYRDAGLRVGLLHHPVYHWDLSREINPKVGRLIDGERVHLLGAYDSASCDLMIVRLPTIVLRRRDDMPRIDAARTVLLVNQTPYKFYGDQGGVDKAWDVPTVRESMAAWVGDHRWYPVGPMVRRALMEHHAHQLDGVDLAPDDWHECLDPAMWRRSGRREPDGTIRVGRHSRDHPLKWPDTAEELRACYPEGDDIEVRVLGGAATPKRILGRLPRNWTEFPFGSMDAREFLHGLDVMVYFIADSGREAFGCAPLEAMAVGLPVVMDRRFEELFGDAAVYCDPADVEQTVRDLMRPDVYERQSQRALDAVNRRFSHEALIRRVAGLGVAAAGRATAD